MSIKFKRSTVERIVREEVASVIKEMYEAGKDEDEPKVHGADNDNDNVEPERAGADMAPKRGAEKKDGAPEGDEPSAPPPGEEPKAKDDGEGAPPPEDPGDKDVPDEEVPTPDDPSDTELSQDVEEPPEEQEPEQSDISKDITGRTVQSVSYNPESKMMGGAAEVVVQFEEIPHPLRILIGKSGIVKFHYKGQVHNEL